MDARHSNEQIYRIMKSIFGYPSEFMLHSADYRTGCWTLYRFITFGSIVTFLRFLLIREQRAVRIPIQKF